MPIMNISNGRIVEITRERGETFVTVSYMTGVGGERREETVRLVVGPRTLIVNRSGIPVPASELSVGMVIGATVSSAMTRSIPPQATAYLIRILRRGQAEPGPPPRPNPPGPPPGPQPPRPPQSPRPPQPPRPPQENQQTEGVILEVDRGNRSFTTIGNRDLSSIIRFNVPDDAVILDRAGRPINFNRLVPGMRVRIRHANFMTASIPPQTTAFEIRIL